MYSKQVHIKQNRSMVQVPMQSKQDYDVMEQAVKDSVPAGGLAQTDNSDLIMFYVTKYMNENVYYNSELDVYAIAEIDKEYLLLYQIFSSKAVELDAVIESFGSEITQVELGFTPSYAQGYTVAERKERDSNLFVLGKVFDEFEKNKLSFPLLAHT